MARKQSRRTVSIVRELYSGLSAVAAERRIPLSQVVGQAAQAVIAGRIELEPALPSIELRCQTRARRAAERPVRQPQPAYTVPELVGTCAICIEVRPVRLSAIEDGGPELYQLCGECRGEEMGP